MTISCSGLLLLASLGDALQPVQDVQPVDDVCEDRVLAVEVVVLRVGDEKLTGVVFFPLFAIETIPRLLCLSEVEISSSKAPP